MKRLYLLRHAKSDWADPDKVDSDRPLSQRGRKAAPAMGRYMRQEGLLPALVLASSARRTEETWDLLSTALKTVIPHESSDKLYLASPNRLMKTVRSLPDKWPSVLIVGHNPGIQAFALELASTENATARNRMTQKYPTGGLAVLDFAVDRWAEISAGKGTLERFVIPRDLD